MNSHPARILIVDDEPAHREAIRRALLEADPGMDIRLAGSLSEYQTAAADTPPDLALIDYLLPDGKATALLCSPPESGPFPIVLMTSHGDQQVAVEAMKQGALDYVVKSREAFAEMPRTVDRTLRAWRLLKERQSALEALTASEALFSRVFRSSPAAITISRFTDGRFLDVNDAFVRLCGFAREEIIGHTADELALWLSPKRAQTIEVLRTRKSLRNLEMRGRRKNGEIRDLLASLELVELSGELCILGSMADLTPLKQAEAALRQSERLQGTILQNIPDPAWMKDMEGRFLMVNKAWSDMLGIPADQAVGHTDAELMPPALAERFRDQERDVAAARKEMRWEEKFPDATGEMHDFETFKAPLMDGDGAVYATIGIARNITDRKRAEESLRASEERLRLALRGAQMGTFDGDLVHNHITWSAQHEILWGLKPGEFEETLEAFLRQVHPEDRPAIQAEWDRCVAHRCPFRREYRVAWPDGSLHWVESAGEFTFDDTGRPVRVRGTVVETTQRRQSERFHALSAAILTLLNETPPTSNTMQRILELIQRETGFDAVGIRLWDGKDYPYQGSLGFSPEFLEAENQLVSRKPDGGLCRDAQGNVSLDCTCGMIISGKVNPNNPQVTPGGSTWTNDARSFLHVPPSADPRLNPRNRCIHQGYQSIALIPVRVNQKIIGLLQLNDRRTGCFTPEGIRFFEGIAASFGLALLRRDEEEALRRNEQRYRNLVETSFDWVWEVDAHGRYTYASPKVEELLGYTSAEVLGRTPFEFMPDAEAERVGAIFREIAARRGSFAALENVNRHKNGHLVVLETSGVPVLGPDGSLLGYRGMDRDITERRIAEEKLRRNEADLREAQRVARVGNWSFDRGTGEVRWSEELYRIFGLAPSDFGGSHSAFLERVHPDDRARVLKTNQEALAAKNSFEIEYRVATPAGMIKTVREIGSSMTDSQGRVTGLFGTAQDVTEQKRAEAALVASEERFRTLVDSAPIGIYVQVAGKFAYVNQGARQMFGFAPEANLIGRSVLHCFDPNEHPRVQEYIQRLNADRQPVLLAEHRCVRHDGTSFDAEFTRVPFVFDGQPGALVFFQDVTERRRLESELRQAQKLDAIGQLAGGVAHDFNNILAAVMMHLGLLRMNQALDENTRHALKDLDSEARRAASLTRQLLMFSRRSVLAVKPLDLNEVVSNLLKMLGRLIGEQNDLRFHDKANLPSVQADAGMVEQVLMNLVVNARDAMPRGGRITISTSVAEFSAEDPALNPVRQPGRFVCLSVSDTGKGMDEATLKRIFEPFFTTKEAGKGTGLGLATVHGIVAQHKGWVEVESKVDRGSTFRVYLPALAQSAAAAAPAPAELLQRGRETILLVEDDAKARLMIGKVLRVLGYRVHEATNGQQAMTLWQNHGSEVDLLLTDMVMPEGMTGLELAEQLQASKPGLKAILSSGYSAEISQAGVPTKAGITYLPKPYEMQTLADLVRKCLDRPS